MDLRISTLAGVRGRRAVVASVREPDIAALDAVARAAAVSRGEIIARLLAVALEDGGKPAVRLLGKKEVRAQPRL